MIVKESTTAYVTKTMHILEADYVGNLTIRLRFTDGHEVTVDFGPFLRSTTLPDLKKYLLEENFQQFTIKDGNLDWNDFEMCFPVDDLYYNQIQK